MLLLVILMTIYFVGFASGFGTRSIISQRRRNNVRKARETRHVRRDPAEGELKHDGKERKNLPAVGIAVLTAVVIVSGMIVLDRFSGPFFPDVFYCLNDGGAQISRMCTGTQREGIAHAPATDVQQNQRGSAEGSAQREAARKAPLNSCCDDDECETTRTKPGDACSWRLP